MSESYAIAELLGEREPQAIALIGRIVRRLGPEQTRAFVDQVRSIEAAGGMPTEDGSRRRTPGGIFFFLVKEHLRETDQADLIQQLFPRRNARRKPDAPPPPPAAGPPVLQGRLRPRMRGRTEQPPVAAIGPAQREQPQAPQASRAPNQDVVLRALDRHLGPAPDIYRRSYNPTTGVMTLLVHFPALARVRYADAIAAASQESGAPIAISSQPHQAILSDVARAAFPEGFPISRIAIHVGRELVMVYAPESIDQAELAAIQERFLAQTGYTLEVVPASL